MRNIYGFDSSLILFYYSIRFKRRETVKKPEPREYLKNIHFWLRKIYYFVSQLDPGLSVAVTDDPENPPQKGEWTELRMRTELQHLLGKYKPEEITQEEAEEACEKIYEMINSIMDPAVIDFAKDPYCAGARPRRIA
jgi:hypothetical protein